MPAPPACTRAWGEIWRNSQFTLGSMCNKMSPVYADLSTLSQKEREETNPPEPQQSPGEDLRCRPRCPRARLRKPIQESTAGTLRILVTAGLQTAQDGRDPY